MIDILGKNYDNLPSGAQYLVTQENKSTTINKEGSEKGYPHKFAAEADLFSKYYFKMLA